MPRKKPDDDKAKESFWRKVIARQLDSGLSQKQFCLREGMSIHMFSWWKREIAKREDIESAPVSPTESPAHTLFVPIAQPTEIGTPNVQMPIFEIDLNARVIRYFTGADRHVLREILTALVEVNL